MLIWLDIIIFFITIVIIIIITVIIFKSNLYFLRLSVKNFIPTLLATFTKNI